MEDVISKTLFESVINKWVEPKVSKLISKLDGKLQLIHHDFFNNKFEEYLERRYLKFSVIDTFVFQNSPKPTNSLYEPITIVKGEKDKRDNQIEFSAGEEFDEETVIALKDIRYSNVSNEITLPKEEKYIVDGVIFEFLRKYPKILLCDDAGMGKSTVLKKIFLSIVQQNIGIPVLIELRKLNKDHSIFNEVLGQISSFDEKIDKNLIFELFKRGDFIFLLDGYDEIPLEQKDIITNDIQRFIEHGYENSFILTSRPESSLSKFGSFENFYIDPLTQKQAFSLIKRYDVFNHKRVANRLITELKSENNSNIQTFLSNSFLVSLLFKAFNYKKVIPFHKPQFFRQIFEALYENHDLSKEGYFIRQKKCGLHIDNFDKVLRYLGFLTAKKGLVEFSKMEILNILEKIRGNTKIDFKPSDFLQDLQTTVPLIKEEGISFRWSHKAMQDYYAAKFIYTDAKEKNAEILSSLFESDNNSRYLNVFDIYFDFDYQGFKEVIIKKWLEKYIDYYDNYLAQKKSKANRDIDLGLNGEFITMHDKKHLEFVGWFYRVKVEPKHSYKELKDAFSELANYYLNYNKCVILLNEIKKQMEANEIDDLYDV